MDSNSLILIVVFFGIMIFMNMRTSRKRKAEAEKMKTQLVPGAKVVLLSGIVGSVVSVSDENVILTTAGSNIEVLKGAIRSVSVWESESPVEAAELPEFVTTEVTEATEEAPVKKTTRTRKPAAPKQTEN
jgi:preprotein translocase subunit YajC